MWQATIDSKSYENGVIRVGVVFFNDKSKVLESFDLTGGSVEILNNRIQNRLDTLNANDGLIDLIPIGPFPSKS